MATALKVNLNINGIKEITDIGDALLVLASSGSQSGIYSSTDKGVNWKRVNEISIYKSVNGIAVYTDVRNIITSGDTLVISTSVGLYRSTRLDNRSREYPQIAQDLQKALLEWHKALPQASAGKNNYNWPGE